MRAMVVLGAAWLLLAAWGAWWGPAWALPASLRFDRIGLEDGLSQASVLAAAQGPQGFLWFGSYDGLQRYDGHSFKVYRSGEENTPGAISDDAIRCLLVDADGVLWAGASAGGLNRYNRESDTFTAFRHAEAPGSLSSDDVYALLEDSTGGLFVGTGGGLDHMAQNGSFTPMVARTKGGESLDIQRVNALAKDEAGGLWVGGAHGLLRMTPEGRVLKRLPPETKLPSGAEMGHVISLLATSQHLWFGCDEGLGVLDAHTGELSWRMEGGRVNTVYKDSSGVIWAGSEDGLARFGTEVSPSFAMFKHNPLNPESLAANEVISILEDRSGILWFGSYTNGLSKLSPRVQQFHIVRKQPWEDAGLSDNNINAVVEDDDGVLWLGTTYGGLNRYDPATGMVRSYQKRPGENDGFPAQEVRSIVLDANGTLWLGSSDAGILAFDRDTGHYVQYARRKGDPTSLPHNNVYCLLDDNGFLWAGMSKAGLCRLDKATGQVRQFEADPGNPNALQHKRVRVMLRHGGALWLGTSKGLHVFDEDNATFRHWLHDPDAPHSLPDDKVTALYPGESPHTLWVGANSGLSLFDMRTETFQRFTNAQGYPFANQFIAAMLRDDAGRLWVSTFKGLSRLDPNTGAVWNFSPKDGLPGYEFMERSACRTAKGDFLFGGLQGLVRFNPLEIIPNRHAPPVVLTGIRVMDAPLAARENVATRKSLTLSYQDMLFEFETAALDFTIPAENRYSHMLAGFEEAWSAPTRSRAITYTNIDPGEYTLRVRAANSDGVWGKEELQLAISIPPPFWMTLWFKLALVAMFLLAVWGLFWWRMRSAKARQALLQQLVDERTDHLERANSQLQGVLQHAPCSIAIKDAAGRYLSCNPQFLSLFQCKHAPVEGKMDAELFDEETLAVLRDADQRAKERGKSDVVEVTVAGRQLLLQHVLLHNPQGAPYGVCGIALDISEKRRLEAESLRSSQLAAIGELAASVAHEINNPINGVVNYAQMIKDDSPPRQAGTAQKIIELGERIASIVRSLLAFSRNGQERPSPVDIRRVVDDSLALTRYLLHRTGAEVEVEVQEGLCLVQGRAGELQQVMVNAISNAAFALREKRNQDAEARLQCAITCRPSPDSPGMVRLEVRDTGIGIPETALSKVTQPFYTTKPRDMGTGLGLAICSRIVFRHDGVLTLESKEGEYTIFRVELPCA